jgi:hypothetical protein
MPSEPEPETRVRVLKLEPTDVEMASLFAALGRGDAPLSALLELLAAHELDLSDAGELPPWPSS